VSPEPPARREEVRGGSVSGPWRGGVKVPPATPAVFVPTWASPAPEEELRAPKLRKGGLAVIETPLAPPAPPVNFTAVGSSEDFPADDWDQGEARDLRADTPEMDYAPPFSATPLVAPARPMAGADFSKDWIGAASANAPERSRRSVLLACVIGAVIAAVIVALAFTFRPALKGEATPATGASTETTTPG
jgi:hypothetical protein